MFQCREGKRRAVRTVCDEGSRKQRVFPKLYLDSDVGDYIHTYSITDLYQTVIEKSGKFRFGAILYE